MIQESLRIPKISLRIGQGSRRVKLRFNIPPDDYIIILQITWQCISAKAVFYWIKNIRRDRKILWNLGSSINRHILIF